VKEFIAKFIARKYDTDPCFALKVKHLISLAFVPYDKVPEYFNILIKEKILSEETTSFLNYFEETYIGKMGLGGIRRPSRYAISYWNFVMFNLSLFELF